MEKITVRLANPLFDRLHTLAVEYSVSTDLLVNAAVRKLIEDVDLLRDLRSGGIRLENVSTYPHA